MKVLVAEDDPITNHLLQALLVKASYLPSLRIGAEVSIRSTNPMPRLMVLDWMIPN